MAAIPIEDVLFYDAETRSTIDLRKSGSWRYVEDENTDVYVVCWCIGDGPIQAWYPGQPVPQAILDHAAAGKYFSAHNVGFEYPLTNRLLHWRYRWPKLTISQMHDTAAEAAAMGLPRALEEVGAALGLAVRKDREGHALMMRMARPRRFDYHKCETCNGTGWYHEDDECWFCKNGTIEIPIWWEDQERIDRLTSYCMRDVEVAREVFKRVRRLPGDERRVWELDQKINERGVKVDLKLAHALEETVEACKMDLDDRMWRITGGAVPKCSNAGALVRWLQDTGIKTDSCAKPVVTALLLDRTVPATAKKALELRRTAGKSSTAKLAVMQYAACRDGRLRGMFRYHGAQTGRFCLAEGTKILVKTPSGEVLERPIETIDTTDLVWDGWEWVAHDGVVFSGEKDVIEHDGIVATREHKVYVSDTEH